MVLPLRSLVAVSLLCASAAHAQAGAVPEGPAATSDARPDRPAAVLSPAPAVEVAKAPDVAAPAPAAKAGDAAAGRRPAATTPAVEQQAPVAGRAAPPDAAVGATPVGTAAEGAPAGAVPPPADAQGDALATRKLEGGAGAEEPLPSWAPEGIDPDQLDERGESMAGTLMRTVLVLGVVLAAIYLTLNVGLRKLMGLGSVGARGNQALVTVVERHAVGPRHALLVVRAGTDFLVVGQTEGGMSLLSKIEPAQVEAHALARAAAPAPSPALSPFLQKLLARKGDTRQSPPPPPAA